MNKTFIGSVQGEGQPQCENPYPPEDGRPCRETAKGIWMRIVAELRDRLHGAEAILKIAEKAETDSPLEIVLCELGWKFNTRR